MVHTWNVFFSVGASGRDGEMFRLQTPPKHAHSAFVISTHQVYTLLTLVPWPVFCVWPTEGESNNLSRIIKHTLNTCTRSTIRRPE